MMKIIDLEVADANYSIENDIPYEVKHLNYHQKYLLLKLGGKIFSLEIESVSDNAFYLRVINENIEKGL